MEKTCGNCEWLKKDKGKPYYCALLDFCEWLEKNEEKPYYCAWLDSLRERHKGSNYHEENDVACADWRYGEQEDEHYEHGET